MLEARRSRRRDGLKLPAALPYELPARERPRPGVPYPVRRGSQLQARNQLIQRYRFMFRFSVSATALGGVVALLSVLGWVASGAMPPALPLGLIGTSLGGLLAYKVLVSTLAVLEGPYANGQGAPRC